MGKRKSKSNKEMGEGTYGTLSTSHNRSWKIGDR